MVSLKTTGAAASFRCPVFAILEDTMIHQVNIDTSSSTGISIADIYAAAADAGLTVSQFEAKVINDAVQAYKRKQNGFAELMDAVRNAAPEE